MKTRALLAVGAGAGAFHVVLRLPFFAPRLFAHVTMKNCLVFFALRTQINTRGPHEKQRYAALA